MALDALVDSAQLDSDLTDVADAIRAKTGGTTPLAFPNEFISEIGSISGGGTLPDGLQDISFNFSGWGSGYCSNNIIHLSTVNGSSSAIWPLNNPITIHSGDIIKQRLTKQSGCNINNWSDSRLVARGRVIDSNINFGSYTTVMNLTYTATDDFELIALYLGARNGNWTDGIILVELFVNDIQIF